MNTAENAIMGIFSIEFYGTLLEIRATTLPNAACASRKVFPSLRQGRNRIHSKRTRKSALY
jgi:hypothetical protein